MNEDLKVCGIYGIFDTLTGECLYVGQSKNAYERCKTHLKRLRSGRHLERFSEWFMSIGKDETRLRFELLESCNDTDDEKNRVEIKWFKILHPKFYGNAPSMNNRWGHSQETRAKISRRTYEAKQKGKHVTCAVYFYTCKMCKKFFASSVKRVILIKHSVPENALTLTASPSKWILLTTKRSKTCMSLVSLR